jgi:hypothetical protein
MAKAVDKAYQTVRERIVKGVYPAASRITEQAQVARRRFARIHSASGRNRHGMDRRRSRRSVRAQSVVGIVWRPACRATHHRSGNRRVAAACRRSVSRDSEQSAGVLAAHRRIEQPVSSAHSGVRRQHAPRDGFGGIDRSADHDEDVRELSRRGSRPQRIASFGDRACTRDSRRRLECIADALAYSRRTRSSQSSLIRLPFGL